MTGPSSATTNLSFNSKQFKEQALALVARLYKPVRVICPELLHWLDRGGRRP